MLNVALLAREHHDLTRRYFLRLGFVGLASVGVGRISFGAEGPATPKAGDETANLTPQQALDKAIAELGYLTPAADFGTVSRGNPLPSELQQETRDAGGWL
jgi:hypothetical protein